VSASKIEHRSDIQDLFIKYLSSLEAEDRDEKRAYIGNPLLETRSLEWLNDGLNANETFTVKRYLDHALKCLKQPLKAGDKAKILRFKYLNMAVDTTSEEWYVTEEGQCIPDYILEIKAHQSVSTKQSGLTSSPRFLSH